MGLLDNVLGNIGGGQPQRGGSSPIGMALLGLLAYGAYKNRDKISDVLSGLGERAGLQDGSTRGEAGLGSGSSFGGGAGNFGGGSGGLGGALGGLLGSAGNALPPGSVLRQGLDNLLESFSQSGNADTARSWVDTGPNREAEPQQIEAAVGRDTVDELARQTGLSRDELLSRLRTALPEMVDRLTPDGRLPTEDEASRWV